MTNPSSNHKLTVPVNMGVLGGGGSSSNPVASAGPGVIMEMKQQGGGARIISASSSVASANSLSSSLSSMNTAGAAGGASEAEAIKSLMKQLSNGPAMTVGAHAPLEEKKDNEIDNSMSSAPQVSQVNKVSSAPAPSAPVGGGVADSPPSAPTNPLVLQMGAPPHPVAEFLFQLTKMLTDNNTEYIMWRNASIFVHDPPGLEKDILPKYFRHSNYSSFQRQMNYFGFRKIAGKGKMAPCSYVNEHAKEDISSLLFIKRKKTGVSSAAAKLMAQQNRINRNMGAGMGMAGLQNSLGGNSALMMGNALGGMGGATAGLNANQFNNFSSMMGGVSGAGAGNMMSAQGSLEQASLLREQQNMLAQLQQAHASALTNPNSMGMGGSNQVGMAQAAQNKLNGNSNAGLIMNDQGNVFNMSSNNPNDWSNSVSAADAAAAQQLFLQQQGLVGGNFPQGMGGANAGDSSGVLRVDSAANLRALINQQISMFNTGSGDPFNPSGMGNLGGQLGAQMPAQGQPQGSSSQQGGGFPAGNEWNELLQRSGAMDNANAQGVTSVADATASLRQLEQQLVFQSQQSQNGAPGSARNVAPGGQPFSQAQRNGFFGQAGAGNGSQGF